MKTFAALVALLALSAKDFRTSEAAITADGCGTTKTCHRDPENCNLSDSGCRFFSWAPGNQNGAYTFEMSGGTGNSQYIAMALAKESLMADADMYYCDGTAVRTGAIQARHSQPEYYGMTGGLIQISAAIENNIAQCAFTRPTSVVKNISNDAEYDFDIAKTEYYFLGAVGPMSVTGSQIQRHDVWKAKTSSSINFSAAPDVSKGCDSDKTCYYSPSNCQPGTIGCYFYSWRKASETTYEFEIVGGGGSGTKYAAMALGTQSKMIDADMYYCDGQTVRSGVIRQAHVAPAYVDTSGLLVTSVKTINGVAYCLFTRPASVNRTVSDGAVVNFDMNKEKYFLLAASGPMAAGNQIAIHTWKDKTDDKIIGSSSGTLNVNQPALFGLVALWLIKASRDIMM